MVLVLGGCLLIGGRDYTKKLHLSSSIFVRIVNVYQAGSSNCTRSVSGILQLCWLTAT